MIDRWLEEATPDRETVGVCFDRALLARLREAQDELAEARKAADGVLGSDEVTRLRAEVDALEAEVRDKTRTFTFESIGWGRWRSLLADHPPESDQDGVFRRAVDLSLLPLSLRDLSFNETTFIPAAIAASCSEPSDLTPKAAMQMIETLPTGVIGRIWSAVLKVNHEGQDDPFARGTVASDVRSTTPST